MGIEFVYAKGKMVLSERKYAIDLLQETFSRRQVFQDVSQKVLLLIRHQPSKMILQVYMRMLVDIDD